MAEYTATFTATDTHSTSAGELSYQIRDAASGGGNLLISGTCTAGAEHTTSTITDNGLSHGSNTRYIRVFDGADNLYETSFSVEHELYLSSAMPTGGSGAASLDGLIAYVWSAMPATGEGAATLNGVLFLPYVSSEMPTGGSATVTLAGITPYVVSGMSVSGSATATLDGVLAFAYSAMPTGGEATATLDGYALAPFVSSPMPTGGSATVILSGVRFPVVSSITVVAPRRPPRPVLTLYPPLGQVNDWQPYEIPLTRPSGLVTYSRVPGGFGELNVMVNPEMARWSGASQHPYRSVDTRFVTYGHVTLTDGDLTLFEGRLVKTTEVAGVVRAIRVMGYGFHAMRDADFESSSSTTTTTGNIVRQVLANAAPFIRVATGSDFVDPQVEHAPEEFSLMMPADIMAQISSEGDDDGNPVDWAIWEGQRLHLKPRVAPSQPHYALAAGDRRILNREEDDSDLRGRVRISYTDAATGNPALTGWHSNRTGNHRRLTVAASELTETSANRLAQAYATLYSRPYLAITVETSHDDMLPGAYGDPVPAYLARAGEWWLVGDDAPLMAIDVQQDWSSGRTRIQLGDEGESYQAMLAWLERDIEQRRGGLNPVGGRAR